MANTVAKLTAELKQAKDQLAEETKRRYRFCPSHGCCVVYVARCLVGFSMLSECTSVSMVLSALSPSANDAFALYSMALEDENRQLRDEVKRLKEQIAELLAEIERLKKIIAELRALLDQKVKEEQAEQAREEMEARRREEEARYVMVMESFMFLFRVYLTIFHGVHAVVRKRSSCLRQSRLR